MANTVVLAVDPYTGIAKKMLKELSLVKQLAPKGAVLQPAYVLSRDSLNWDGSLSPIWLRNLKTSTFKAMTELQRKNLTSEPMILVNNKTSIKSDAEELCRFAAQKGASFVVLNTHARKGVQRFLLGSFAEAVMVKIKVPLLLFNPRLAQPKRIKKVLISLDLSRKSVSTFKQQIPMLKRLGAELVLYNKMLDPIEPVVQAGVIMAGGGWVGLESYRDEDRVNRHKQLDEVANELRRNGLRVKTVVDDSYGTVSDHVIKMSRKVNAQMILMGTQVGSAGALVFGSVARAVVRNSKVPVFVFPVR